MAYVLNKSEERKADERYVMRSFGINPNDSAGREYAETIAARSREAYNELRRMEEYGR
jgi:hypothetical protein